MIWAARLTRGVLREETDIHRLPEIPRWARPMTCIVPNKGKFAMSFENWLKGDTANKA